MTEGQLSLIANGDKVLRLSADFGRQLPGCVQVSQHFDIRGKENHVLLAAAIRHLKQVVNAVDALGNQARRDA